MTWTKTGRTYRIPLEGNCDSASHRQWAQDRDRQRETDLIWRWQTFSKHLLLFIGECGRAPYGAGRPCAGSKIDWKMPNRCFVLNHAVSFHKSRVKCKKSWRAWCVRCTPTLPDNKTLQYCSTGCSWQWCSATARCTGGASRCVLQVNSCWAIA